MIYLNDFFFFYMMYRLELIKLADVALFFFLSRDGLPKRFVLIILLPCLREFNVDLNNVLWAFGIHEHPYIFFQGCI